MCDRSARGTKFTPELFLRNVAGDVPSSWTLLFVVVSKSSEEIQERSAACAGSSVGQQIAFSLSIQTLTVRCTR